MWTNQPNPEAGQGPTGPPWGRSTSGQCLLFASHRPLTLPGAPHKVGLFQLPQLSGGAQGTVRVGVRLEGTGGVGRAGTRARVRAAVGEGPSRPVVFPTVTLPPWPHAGGVTEMKRAPITGLACFVLKRQLGNQQLERQHQAAAPPRKGVRATLQLPLGQRQATGLHPHSSTKASELFAGHIGPCGSWVPRACLPASSWPPHCTEAFLTPSSGSGPPPHMSRRPYNAARTETGTPTPMQPSCGLPAPSAPR